ncbi:DNA-binding transcriptional activator of the allD operon [Klebsiella pneumoniae]|nr:DNA-binding transcriptional activator of the allD operon [Klebsiella pneumoniae]
MNSIFNEENLQVLISVVRCGSFSKAAQELGITTSAVSYAVKRIETGLGVALFTRSTRSVELTEAGHYFWRKSGELLNDIQRIKRGVDTIAQGIEPRVRICINQLLYTPHHTARLLQLLDKQFPGCQVVITTAVYNGVWDALVNQQVNVAIGAPDTLPDGGGIDYLAIGSVRWQFAIAPDHPLARLAQPLSESQLRQWTTIMVEDTAETLNKKVGWLLHGQQSLVVPDFATKCHCQMLGQGIGFLPDYLVREAGQRLVTPAVQNPRQDSPMLLATQHAASGQVTQWIRQQFAAGGVLSGLYQDLLHLDKNTDIM